MNEMVLPKPDQHEYKAPLPCLRLSSIGSGVAGNCVWGGGMSSEEEEKKKILILQLHDRKEKKSAPPPPSCYASNVVE